jgi:hypothetical protein
MREPVDSAPTQRQAMIAVAAYFLAESRGFIPGRELDDWLAAERAIDHALAIEPLEIGVWK